MRTWIFFGCLFLGAASACGSGSNVSEGGDGDTGTEPVDGPGGDSQGGETGASGGNNGTDAGGGTTSSGGDGNQSCGDACSAGQGCEDGECVNLRCVDLDCSETERCEEHEAGGHVCVDNTCELSSECPDGTVCGSDGVCVGSVCEPGRRLCADEGTLVICSPLGDEERSVECVSTPNFASVCVDGVEAACSCSDDWDCPENMRCESGLCQGSGLPPECVLEPVPFSETAPEVEFHWGGLSDDDDDARDATGALAPWPEYSHVLSTPIVANLDDDNGDGQINELDFPEIIFAAYRAQRGGSSEPTHWRDNAILRAISAGGPHQGTDLFAVCGDQVWRRGDPTPETCRYSGAGAGQGAGDVNAGATPAVADLDGDGLPEVLYFTESDDLKILSNTGALKLDLDLMFSLPPGLATTIAVANLDQTGLPEVIVGSTVVMLESNESDLVATHMLRTGGGLVARGANYLGTTESGGTLPIGAMSCPADLLPRPGMELVVGMGLYGLPDELPTCGTAPCQGFLNRLWDARTVEGNDALRSWDDGLCAVANVWGPDREVAPGPQNRPEDDPAAEVVVISAGSVSVLDSSSGAIIEHLPATGPGGGAPNVDDFDGDGFVEVAALMLDDTESRYKVFDFQAPSLACPVWEKSLTFDVGDSEEPSTFNPNLTDSPRTPGGPCSEDADCADGAVCGARGACICLHNGWARDADDNSSRATSSSVFDFNGDGAAEAVYNDECEMRAFDGRTGAVLAHELSRSRTIIENPVIADVDNDGNAEIVTVLNTEQGNRCVLDETSSTAGPNGIRVWGDPTDSWVAARRIYNQHNYHVTNVTESGAIPEVEPASWLPVGGRLYNSYRSQPRNVGVAPDLAITKAGVSSPDAQCGELGEFLEIGFQVENLGDLRVGPGIEVAVFGTWGTETEILHGIEGELRRGLEQSLSPGGVATGSFTFVVTEQEGRIGFPDQVRVVVDPVADGEQEFGGARECREANNERVVEVEAGSLRADLAVSSLVAERDCEGGASLQLFVENAGTAAASDIEIAVYAGDPSQGGRLLYRETLLGSIQPGGSRGDAIEFEDAESEANIDYWVIVDPLDEVPECNDANNRGAVTASCGQE